MEAERQIKRAFWLPFLAGVPAGLWWRGPMVGVMVGGVWGTLTGFATVAAIATGAAVLYAAVWLGGGQRGPRSEACIRWIARVLAISAAFAVVFAIKLGYDPLAEMAFRRHVLAPIPVSVRGIRSAGRHAGDDLGYLLRFRAEPGDMEQIVKEHVLRERDSASFIREQELATFGGWRGRPDWWTLEGMVAPKAFERTHSEGKHYLLIYDPISRTALFASFSL